MVLHAFVTIRIDHCNGLLYGLPDCEIAKLQRVHNAAARLQNLIDTVKSMLFVYMLISKFPDYKK